MSCDSSFGERSLCSNYGYYCESPPLGCICDHDWTGKSHSMTACLSIDAISVTHDLSWFQMFVIIPITSEYGDFALTPGLDCDISKISLKFLYSLIIATSIFNGLQIAHYLILRSYEKKVYFYISWQPRLLFPWVFLVELSVQAMFSIIKLIYGEELLVGRDMNITCLLELSGVLSFYGLILYFFVVLKFLQTYTTMLVKERREKLESQYAFLKAVATFIPPLGFIFCYITVFGIIYPNFERQSTLASLIGVGFLALSYGWITTTALKNLRYELSSHISSFPQSSDDIRLVLKRLTSAYRIILVMSTLMGLSYFVFCFDYMLRKSSYLLIWLHMSWPGVATILVTTVSQITNNRPPSVKFTSSGGRQKVGIYNAELSTVPCETSSVPSQMQSV